MATYGPEIFKLKDGREVVLRHCEASDAETYLEFQKLIAIESTHTYQKIGRTADLQRTRDFYKSTIEDPLSIRIGAFDGARLVGEIGIRPIMNPPHPWVRHIGQFGMMVLQEFWGQGLGSRLLAAMDDHARQSGISRIEAMVRKQNQRGIHLYKKNGFVFEGERRNAAFINGEFQDEYFIAKLL